MRWAREITRERIAATERLIRPYVRRTPIIEADAAFAALLSGRYQPEKSERVGVVLCGGNTIAVDFDR